jgi:tetratricopeptide (TPR) repeat protein
VEEYCTKVREDPRLKEQDLEPLRKELLQSAVQFHQLFVEQHRDDPALRSDLGRAYTDLGELLGEVDSLSRGIDYCRQSAAVYDQLIGEHPDDSSSAIQLARSLSSLGKFLNQSAQPMEAKVVLYRALEVLDRLPVIHRDSPLVRTIYLRTSFNLGHLLRFKIGARAEAIAVCRRGLAYLEGGNEREARGLEEQARQLQMMSFLALILVESGATDEGRFLCNKAMQLLENLATSTKLATVEKNHIASAYSGIGRTYSLLFQPNQALEAFHKAVDLFQQLVARHPGVRTFQESLGNELNSLATTQLVAGKRTEALVCFGKSLEIKQTLVDRYPDIPDFKANLARTLLNLSHFSDDLMQGLAFHRRAEALLEELVKRFPNVKEYQTHLATSYNQRVAIHRTGNQVAEAIETLDQAIAVWERLSLGNDILEPRQQLTTWYAAKAELCQKTDNWQSAADSLRKASKLNPETLHFPYQLGNILMSVDRLEEAIEAFQRALTLKPEFAEAHCNLGHSLLRIGKLTEGRAELQKGHDLGSRQPNWPYPSDQWVRKADTLIQLDAKLSRILDEKDKPANATQRLNLAILCQQNKGCYVLAVRFYREAFDEQPTLAEDPRMTNRYRAACAAAMAGCGQGRDAADLDATQRAALRKQALAWLQAELAAWTRLGADPKEHARIRPILQLWQQDRALADVREAKALAELPEAERVAWQKLWADRDDLSQPHQGNRSRPTLSGTTRAERQAVNRPSQHLTCHFALAVATPPTAQLLPDPDQRRRPSAPPGSPSVPAVRARRQDSETAVPPGRGRGSARGCGRGAGYAVRRDHAWCSPGTGSKGTLVLDAGVGW